MDGAMPDERAASADRISALELAFRGFAERKGDAVVVPSMGLAFDSLGEACDYYNLYSWECGFGIRYGKSRTNVKGAKSIVRRSAKKRVEHVGGSETPIKVAIVSEIDKTDEMKAVLALESCKKNALEKELPASSLLSGHDQPRTVNFMEKDTLDNYNKKRSLSEIDRLLEVSKRHRLEGKTPIPDNSKLIPQRAVREVKACEQRANEEVLLSYNNLLDLKGFELKRNWIDHGVPTDLKLSGAEIQGMIKKDGYVNTRQFEIFRRFICQEDENLYAPGSIFRLRRVIHLSWAAKVLAGEAVQINNEIRSSLVGVDGKFNLEYCRLIMALHSTVDGYYILYVFNMQSKVVHFMDAANTWQLETSLKAKHLPICNALLSGLSSLISQLYPGSHID